MATFEVEVDDWDLEQAGWVHEDDLKRNSEEQIVDAFKEAIKNIDHHYFRENLPKDQTYNDIIHILEQTCGI